MKAPDKLNMLDIAPCGLVCMGCRGYLNAKRPCRGCRASDEELTRVSCVHCAIRTCAREKGMTWCFACEAFPCQKVKGLSKRYVTKYGIDLIKDGLDARQDAPMLAENLLRRLACPACGGVIDHHSFTCSGCGVFFGVPGTIAPTV